MRQILKLPQLPNGTPQSNLAGILPLSSLIELIDVKTKLHCYELSGFGIMWNWPVTPAGAHLMLERCRTEEDKNSSGCLLDMGTRTPLLQCIDMRYGNVYACINSFTVRACVEAAPLHRALQPSVITSHRFQRLEVVHVYRDMHGVEEAGESLPQPPPSIEWLVALWVGCAVWGATVAISVICAMPLALAYLLILPATGFCVHHAFGHHPRPLLVEPVGPTQRYLRRSILTANHLNEVEWTVYVGDSRLVNALLNKPLLPARNNSSRNPFKNRKLLRLLLRVLIAGQWGIVLAVSALQDWDAIFISAALIVCACTSTFLFGTSHSVNIWLKSNHIGLEKLSVTFTGRRAMLSALVAISPDCQPTQGLATRWIDDIMERAPSRVEWERLLQERLLQKPIASAEKSSSAWLVEVIEEGVQKASEINKWILERERYHNVPDRPPSQVPFIITPKPGPPATTSPA